LILNKLLEIPDAQSGQDAGNAVPEYATGTRVLPHGNSAVGHDSAVNAKLEEIRHHGTLMWMRFGIPPRIPRGDVGVHGY
jgi:hypothetical protein